MHSSLVRCSVKGRHPWPGSGARDPDGEFCRTGPGHAALHRPYTHTAPASLRVARKTTRNLTLTPTHHRFTPAMIDPGPVNNRRSVENLGATAAAGSSSIQQPWWWTAACLAAATARSNPAAVTIWPYACVRIDWSAWKRSRTTHSCAHSDAAE